MRVTRCGKSPGNFPGLVVLLALSAALTPTAIALSAVTATTQHGLNADTLNGMISSADLIQGKNTLDVDVFVNPVDSFGNQSLPGWHPANTNPADQHAAFTDGAGILASGLTGLLNDNFPVETASGRPAKIVEYPFDSPVDIGKINIFTGNRNNADGRIFSTTYVEYSTDGGGTLQPLGYFQSDPSGTINNEALPIDQQLNSTLVSIFDDGSSTLLSGVTNIVFNFYSVDNTGGQMRDPFDGPNFFTSVDDGLTAAFVSPLVFEIDVLAPQQGLVADYNSNNVIDAADYVVWRDSVGGATLPNRDPGVAGPVGQADYDAWKARFGNTSGIGAGGSAAVPEPSALGMIFPLLGVLLGIRATKNASFHRDRRLRQH